MPDRRQTPRTAATAGNGGASPFELDMLAQADALRDFLSAPRPRGLVSESIAAYPRVIITGMGSSHFAGLRTWRQLVAAGLPAWWVGTAELLDSLELVADGSLLVVTSQSGASGETVALLDALRERGVAAETIGVTNDEHSPLAHAADLVVALHSGEEATVSTKSYINTLAAHEDLVARLLGGDQADVSGDLERGLRPLESGGHAVPSAIAAATVAAELPRIAVIGEGDHGATALYGGLIIKESTKLPAEGFVAGNFRHGPLEMAGPGLTALFIGVRAAPEGEPLRRLAADVADTGATVLTLGDTTMPGCDAVADDMAGGFPGLVLGALVCQRFSVSLARARGIVPGEFRFGQKVTAL
jgi:glucosamine--fructose-6-phosphate aminotransferase (isomerizing)